jgi:putative ABC transport system ATP-binding protein
VSELHAVLRAENLYRFYHVDDEETLALRGVSVSVARGEVVAITGPSGSGKSTLMACLSGMDNPDGGTVYIGERRISRLPEAERRALRARHVGVMFQSGNLIESLTVRGNLALVQRLAGKRDAEHLAALAAALGVEARLEAHPSELSGGELCRAGLAVALAGDPDVLVADEPTGEVDSVTEQRVLRLLQRQAGEGLAVIVVTHSDAVAACADRVLRIVDGQVAA